MVCACTVWNVSPEVEGFRICLLSVSYGSFSSEGLSMTFTRGWTGGRALTKPLSSSAYSMRRFRERMRQNPQLYRMYRDRQSAWNRKYASKFKQGKPNWVDASVSRSSAWLRLHYWPTSFTGSCSCLEKFLCVMESGHSVEVLSLQYETGSVTLSPYMLSFTVDGNFGLKSNDRKHGNFVIWTLLLIDLHGGKRRCSSYTPETVIVS